MSRESSPINPFGIVESTPEQEKNIQDYEYQIKLSQDRIKELVRAEQNPLR